MAKRKGNLVSKLGKAGKDGVSRHGSDETTFFGQFERNSNVYFALRYGF